MSSEEQATVHSDDTLLWRLVYLGIVGDFVKKSIDPKDRMIFALEQPEEPRYKPEVVSFWWTREWKSLKLQMNWHEQAFNQGDLVYKPEATPVKPTKFGGNLELELTNEKNNLAVSRPSGGSGDSKSLARWVPRLMDLVADALCRQAFKETEIKCKAMTWAEHCAAGHVPFRRDCRVCQEASAKGRPHRKVAYPLNGTLSVDVAGPLKKAKEMFWAEGGGYMRYILVGAFTWLKPKGGESDPPEVHEGDHGEDLPELADDEAEEDPVPGEGDGGERQDEETPEGDEPQEEETQERQEPQHLPLLHPTSREDQGRGAEGDQRALHSASRSWLHGDSSSQRSWRRVQRQGTGAVVSHEGHSQDEDGRDVATVQREGGEICAGDQGAHSESFERCRDGSGVLACCMQIRPPTGTKAIGDEERQTYTALRRSGTGSVETSRIPMRQRCTCTRTMRTMDIVS